MSKRITSEDQITFEDYAIDKQVHWQTIEFDGKRIGALAQWSGSFLEPHKERYQKCVPEAEAPLFDGWYESEDEGYIFGYFHTLEKFIEYYNSKLD